MEETLEGRTEIYTLEDLQKAVKNEYEAADSFCDLLSRDRIELTKAYEAQPLGNEMEGRSTVVMTDVRDTISAILPSLMRVFFGFSKPVEFVPTSPDQQKINEAEQASDFVDYVIKYDNPGFVEFYRWFKDALIRRIGVMKVYWDERATVEALRIKGGDPEITVALAAEAVVDPSVSVQVDGEDFAVTRRRDDAGVKIRCVPPEDFVFCADAVNVEDARYVAHRAFLPASDVIAMGYSREDVEEAVSNNVDNSIEKQYRDYKKQFTIDVNRDDIAGKYVLFIEHYIRFDGDGDGVAELHRVITLGDTLKIVAEDVVTEHPFVVITPDPEPHELVGLSVAEKVMDLQKSRTMIMRGLLDSLALTTAPRFAVVEGRASLADVLNTEIGAPIRQEAPGMVTPLSVPFVGGQALPVLEYMDKIKENRTGVTKASVGLSPESLQSATKIAVDATIRGAREHIELIARVFAETGVAPLYRKIYHLLVRNQIKPRVVKLRGGWAQVAPTSWSADLNVVVRVGIGEGTNEDKVSLLQGLTAKMEWIMQTMGPSNFLVRPSNYKAVLSKILELSGIYNTNDFFQQVDVKREAEAIEAAAKPAPEPAEMLAQVQIEQIKAEIAMKQADLQLKEKDMLLKHQYEEQKLKQDYELKLLELKLKYGGNNGT